MACFHKFYGHPSHLDGNMGLLPNWECNTLIIGTFNPDTFFHPQNPAQYFYGRSAYFWQLISRFLCCENEIQREDTETQLAVLQKKRIGITDLLMSVNDANENSIEDVKRICTVRDNELELFNDFTWNTDNIISFINDQRITHVYFTKLGYEKNRNPRQDTFENQMRIIEGYCDHNNIFHDRLHTPTGLGLGAGKPRENKLIKKWFNENGADHFPFISNQFNIDDYPYFIGPNQF